MAAFLTNNPASMKEIQELNQAILGWIPKVRTQLKTSALQFADGKTQSFIIRKRKIGNQKEFKLILSLDSKTHKEYSAIDGVGFLFERHGVFVHKGVGRGYKADGTVNVKHPSGNPRQPVEWFNPIMQQKVPELANRLAQISADAVLNAARLRIV
jgi:hypothetical protein